MAVVVKIVIVERFVLPKDPESYATGSVSHTCQIICSPWYFRLGVERGAINSTPEKFTITKPWRRSRPTLGCRVSEEERRFGRYL